MGDSSNSPERTKPGAVDALPLDEGTATDPSASQRQPPKLLAPGDPIGRYEVVSVLGAGGMGVVYRARDPDLERDVAIKLLRAPAPGSADSSGVKPELRLLREARAMAKLVHPNLVTVFDVGTYEGRVFVAMEYVEGQTFKQWVSGPESPDWHQRLAVAMAAGRGLARAHAAGVVHRDLKPDNILVARDGTALVADFGLARNAGEAEDLVIDQGTSDAPRDPLAAQITTTGALLGTPAYMSPEQFLGKPADFRSDQFSFAVVVYWALWGRRPFAGEHVQDLASAVLLGRVADPPGDTGVPGALFEVVARALRPRPEERYESIDAFLAALETATRRRGKIVPVVLAAAALAVLLAGAAIAFTRNSPGGDPPEPVAARTHEVRARAAEVRREHEPMAEAKAELSSEMKEAMAAFEAARSVAGEHMRFDVAAALSEFPAGEIPETIDYAEHGTLVALRVAAEHIEDVTTCIREQTAAGRPALPGVVMELAIDRSGQVTATSTPLRDEASRALARCVGRASRSWKFPRPRSGKSVKVTLPLMGSRRD